MNDQEKLRWRRKLNAYLHDSPDKATEIATHEFRAGWLKALDQFTKEEKFEKAADWAASAADRLPFPKPPALFQAFHELEKLPHPLGGALLESPTFASATEAFENSQTTRPFLHGDQNPQVSFLCVWRFWRNWACRDSRFSHLPADTRVPDHSIWHHLAVTTAFEGSNIPIEKTDGNNFQRTFCRHSENPCLILFSLGPVQDFIAAARSTRDLWSGSYLLSFLVSSALGKIARDLGPDHLIFPNLIDQPLLDLQLKDLYEKGNFSEKPIWEGFDYTDKNLPKLLTPSLPNRFLALIPATLPDGTKAEDYGKTLADTIQKTLNEIAASVAEKVKTLDLKFDFDRFNEQTTRILEAHWQTLAIPETFEQVWQIADQLLPADNEQFHPRKAVAAIREMIQKDGCSPQYPASPTSAWGLLNALISWLHDGTKAHRNFDAWATGEWHSGKKFNKDSLNGKEEAVLEIPRDGAEKLGPKLGMSKGTLKANELLGASTLIKRLWWYCYLPAQIGIDPATLKKRHPMPNTHAIAVGEPFADSDDLEDEGERYFAILALDGDEMGKWISGSKSPEMKDVLSPEAVAFYEKNVPAFLKAPRAVTPSWHLQFSEALGNFSFHCAQRIVETYDGRLLYAGGDDVLAMLPAKEALACARALRAAFRGEKDYLNQLDAGEMFQLKEDGFLRLHEKSRASFGADAGLLSDPVTFPALLPGPKTDVSVGIAIAHQKSPLQDVVRAAQTAEKRAKSQLGRAAVAITILKRSGEILEWGTKWAVDDQEDSAGFCLLKNLMKDLEENKLNKRFPHKLEALLNPYLPDSDSIIIDDHFEKIFPDLLLQEVQHVLKRNEGGNLGETKEADFTAYWAELGTLKQSEKETATISFRQKLELFINLLRTAAWSVR